MLRSLNVYKHKVCYRKIIDDDSKGCEFDI